MTAICLHCFISGRVQGVFFRRHTYEMAMRLDLKGWVRNLDDGRVEVMVCGEEAQVNHMQTWLWQGPSTAKVSQVESHHVPYEIWQDFEIK